jgi:tRNA(Ile)-lysidine synthase
MEVQSQNTKLITTDQFNALMTGFKGFENEPHVAVAVSGGSDSMALALLVKEWTRGVSGRLTCLIVDHGLRAESREEAEWVKAHLTDLGIEAVILTWEGEKPKARIQEVARAKRYELLEAWCERHHVLHLLVAHHGDDQWETVMYRLSKGSDLKGLLGIQPVVQRPFGRILRPFLGFSKEAVSRVLKSYQGKNVEDPSNQNDKFTRIKWRQMYPSLAALELDREGVKRAIHQWQGSHALCQQMVNRFIYDLCRVDDYGCVWISLPDFLSISRDGQHRVLKKIINSFCPNLYGVESKSITFALGHLFEEGQNGVTLGGCYLLKRKHHLLVMRELRAVRRRMPIQKNTFFWDERFLIHVPETYLGMEIGPLGGSLAQQWSKKYQIHSKILETLPGLFMGDECCVPIHSLGGAGGDSNAYCFTGRVLID